MNRLALGTAQFGLHYGVANSTGQVGPNAVRLVLDRGRQAGMDLIDTAIAYGTSEATLGAVGVSGWNVVTKLPACPPDVADVRQWVREQVRQSMGRLRVTELHGLLLHRPAQLLDRLGHEILAELNALKGEGVVRKWGISVYGPDELDYLCTGFSPELVQLPYNAMDGRWNRSGWVRRLADAGVEIHARSVFLQGLLLLHPDSRPAYFQRWAAHWSAWDECLERNGRSGVEICLGAALAVPELHRIVVGVDSVAQLEQVLQAAGAPPPSLPDGLQTSDPELIDPSKWQLQ